MTDQCNCEFHVPTFGEYSHSRCEVDEVLIGPWLGREEYEPFIVRALIVHRMRKQMEQDIWDGPVDLARMATTDDDDSSFLYPANPIKCTVNDLRKYCAVFVASFAQYRDLHVSIFRPGKNHAS